jgi:hypothetical protein
MPIVRHHLSGGFKMPQATTTPPGVPADERKELKPLEALTAFKEFSNTLVGSMKEIHDIADSKASTFLYTLGTVILFLTLFLRIAVFGATVSNMRPSEFITIAILAVVLILVATLLRFYQYWFDNEVARDLRDVGVRILENNQETARKLLEGGQEKAKESRL